MSWTITPQQRIPAVIGEPFGGGYFAGYISHTADGNPTHALIVAPRATGATGTGYTLTGLLQWKTAGTSTSGTTSSFDGRANTDAIIAAGINDHPAAKFCVDLTVGGYTDWYLPSRLELNIAYFELKPNNTLNSVGGGTGTNIYAVPRRSTDVVTSTFPGPTSVAGFNSSLEGFVANIHWASDQTGSVDVAWRVDFSNGSPASGSFKTSTRHVRAFRRIAL